MLNEPTRTKRRVFKALIHTHFNSKFNQNNLNRWKLTPSDDLTSRRADEYDVEDSHGGLVTIQVADYVGDAH